MMHLPTKSLVALHALAHENLPPETRDLIAKAKSTITDRSGLAEIPGYIITWEPHRTDTIEVIIRTPRGREVTRWVQ
jgi:hypothetical protein